MTDQTLARGPYPPAAFNPSSLAFVARLARRLLRRDAGGRELRRLNDRMLADVGLTRGRLRGIVGGLPGWRV